MLQDYIQEKLPYNWGNRHLSHRRLNRSGESDCRGHGNPLVVGKAVVASGVHQGGWGAATAEVFRA